MGWIQWFKGRKKKNEEPIEEIEEKDELEKDREEADRLARQPVKFEKEKIRLEDTSARLSYLRRLYEAIQDAKKQCGDIKFEYGQVTSYLKDIQLIEQAPDEERMGMLAAARRIVDLTEERARLQRQTYKMTDAQKRAMENFEGYVRDDTRKLQEYEDYQIKIKNDLRQLASEKELLLGDKRDIIRNQNVLKSIGKSLGILFVAFGLMLLVLMLCFKVNIEVPFIATVAFAFVVAAIILNEARKNRIDMVITEKKCNRAIFLTNRVKIKYVNNVRTIDYMCHKYQVRNAIELEFVFGQYCKAKKEWAKQRESTRLLHECNQVLLHELGRMGVKDREIWYSQARALVDPKEMVEVRHDLNVRRQKLREQLEYNTSIIEECLSEMEMIRDKKPEYAEEVERVLEQGIR